jgi:hypothetical protein
MIRFIVIISALSMLVWPAVSLPDPSAAELECTKVKLKIAKIESRMRQGYTASEGRRYEEELRRLRRLRASVCR